MSVRSNLATLEVAILNLTKRVEALEQGATKPTAVKRPSKKKTAKKAD